MTELNLKPIQIELEPTTEDALDPIQSGESKVAREYNYTINGKPKTVKRNYTIKDTTSFRTKSVRDQVKKYVEDNKKTLSEVNKRHRASTLINNVQKDMNIHISYNSAIKLLTEAGIKE